MSIIESKLSPEYAEKLSEQIRQNNYIDPEYFSKFGVKRGLRNADGTGVMAGVTKICSVEGYYIEDGEKLPKDGHLIFRGVDVSDLVNGCIAENRFGYEEVVWLLLFGKLPTKAELEMFCGMLSISRELPKDFIEDMIMKVPSNNVMNKMSRSVLALYSYDSDPENTETRNVLRQCLDLIAKLPVIMSYAYQVKRRNYYNKSMYIHPLKQEYLTAQTILRSIRADKKFTDEEAKLLDICLMIHAEHGGGNNSTFSTRVLTSSGTDTYSIISAGIGSLKGPKHGGANIKVSDMINDMLENISDTSDDGQVCDYLRKILRKDAGDGSGLIYGMGHAVYTLSDPRAVILKQQAAKFSLGTEYEKKYRLIESVERLTPEVFYDEKGIDKAMCANVDLYSGLIYEILRIPQDLYTPLFTVARIAGWSAHRIEEMLTGGRIIRPAYKNVRPKEPYVPINDR